MTTPGKPGPHPAQHEAMAIFTDELGTVRVCPSERARLLANRYARAQRRREPYPDHPQEEKGT